jgi:hypothetical protein
MTPLGDVGKSGVRAYAARTGQTEHEYIENMGELLTPELAGTALVGLIGSDPAATAAAYLLTAGGLQKV